MKIEKTARGFPIAKAADIYGDEWSVQDSSLADAEAVWLGGLVGRAHLTREAVAGLIPVLQRFVDTGSIRE